MINGKPDSLLIENRYRAERYLLIQQYPELEQMDKDTLLAILKDAVWIDRQLRLYNEANEKPLKELLEQEKIIELQQ